MQPKRAPEPLFKEAIHPLEDGLVLAWRDYPAAGGVGKLPVVCLHALTRNERDFEDVAPRIAAAGRRAIVPTMRGRGRSAWDPKPERYHPGVYAADVKGLLDALGVPRAVFLGTSLGGIVTMVIAAQEPQRIAACVLNDVGAQIEIAGLERIKGYVGRGKPAKDWAEAAQLAREVNGSVFPAETGEAFWLAFARRTRRRQDDLIVTDYDPAIGDVMRAAGQVSGDLWAIYKPLASIPTLLVRGETSDLLTVETTAAMKAAKPDLEVVEVPGVGHAPLLTEPVVEAALDAFLARVP